MSKESLRVWVKYDYTLLNDRMEYFYLRRKTKQTKKQTKDPGFPNSDFKVDSDDGMIGTNLHTREAILSLRVLVSLHKHPAHKR